MRMKGKVGIVTAAAWEWEGQGPFVSLARAPPSPSSIGTRQALLPRSHRS